MNVQFSTINKRINSTKQSSGGASYDCILKDASGIEKPRIVLKWQGGGAPRWNHAYIPEYGRYYWVNDWIFVDRCWEASMEVDVLASFKDQIGAAEKYILRSSSSFGRFVQDTMYPAQNIARIKKIDIEQPDFFKDFGQGAVVIGIVGQGNTFNVNGAGYLAVTPNMLQRIIQSCYNAMDGVWDEASLGADIGEALAIFGKKFAMSIYNPIQYINSVMWLPYYPPVGSYTSVWLGQLSLGISLQTLSSPITRFDFTIRIPTYSNEVDIDQTWHIAEPYSHYKIVFPPFGTFIVPGSEVINYDNGYGESEVSAQIVADAISGQATLSIPDLGICASCQLGIPLELAGNSVDWAGGATALLGVGSGLRSGTPTGIVGGVINGIINAESAMNPAATHGSIGGGMAALNSKRYAQVTYNPPTEEDPNERGKALCQVKTIGSQHGYILCADGDIEAPATAAELSQIASFLTGGFFYE